MSISSRFLLVLFGITVAILCAAQLSAQKVPTQSQAPPWALLMDPVCPVAPFPGRARESNASTELRVLYFPTAKDAKLKDSKIAVAASWIQWPELREQSCADSLWPQGRSLGGAGPSRKEPRCLCDLLGQR
jgi:hypothetical protein